MLSEAQHDRLYYWKKNKNWYHKVNNSYEYELNDEVPEEAVKSFGYYKKAIDRVLNGRSPYEGVVVDL